jgi:hypothetical protein
MEEAKRCETSLSIPRDMSIILNQPYQRMAAIQISSNLEIIVSGLTFLFVRGGKLSIGKGKFDLT